MALASHAWVVGTKPQRWRLEPRGIWSRKRNSIVVSTMPQRWRLKRCCRATASTASDCRQYDAPTMAVETMNNREAQMLARLSSVRCPNDGG